MEDQRHPAANNLAVEAHYPYGEHLNDQPTYPGAEGQSQTPPTQSPLQGSVATATARIQVIIEAAEKAAAGIIDDAEAQAQRYLEESRVRADSIADQRAGEISAISDDLIRQAETVKRQSDELIQALGQAKRQVNERFADEAAPPAPASAVPPPIEPPQFSAPLPEEPEFEPEPEPVRLKPLGPAPEPAMPPLEALPSEPPEPTAPAAEEGEDMPVQSLPDRPPVAFESVPPPVASSPPEVETPPVAEPSIDPETEREAPVPPPPGPRAPGAPPSDGARLLATQMAVAGSSRAEIESRLQNEFGIWDAGPMLDAILGREG